MQKMKIGKHWVVLCLGLAVATSVKAAPLERSIKLQNVKPSFLIQIIQQNFAKLPANVTLEPEDKSNSLIVTGEVEALQQLEKVVRELDVPLRQIEVEAKIVAMDAEDTKTFGLVSSAAEPGATTLVSSTNPEVLVALSKWEAVRTFSSGALHSTYAVQLDKLVEAKRAEILSAPRLTVINGVEAKLASTELFPIKPDLYLKGSTGIAVTSTLSVDNTMTLEVRPPGRLTAETKTTADADPYSAAVRNGTFNPLGNRKVNPLGPSESSLLPQIRFNIAKLKNGDTVAVSGVIAKQFLSLLTNFRERDELNLLFKPTEGQKPERELVIFFRAHEIRRLEEATPVQVAARN